MRRGNSKPELASVTAAYSISLVQSELVAAIAFPLSSIRKEVVAAAGYMK
jgi:hypothetical protein